VEASGLPDLPPGAGQRRDAVAQLLTEQLPAPNRALAQVLFLYLARLADHALRNRMDAASLGDIFGPLLLRPQPDSSAESVQHAPRIVSLIKYIIQSYDSLFGSGVAPKLPSTTENSEDEKDSSGSAVAAPENKLKRGKNEEESVPPDRFQQIVDAIDESIALVQSKLLALHKRLETVETMEEAIQIAKKIRSAKRILFHEHQKQAKPHANDGASEPNGKPAAECAPGTLDGASLVVESGFESLQGIRKTMEDAHVALDDLLTSFPHLSSLHPSPPFAFYAVYDGHAGAEAAAVAADLVHVEIIKEAAFAEGRVEEALREGFRKADALILEKSARDGWKNGTTAVVGFVLSRTVYVANVGDSEAIMGRRQSDGSLKPVVLSHKHKPTDKDEKERIRAAGGHVVFGRLFGDLAVSRSLGDPDYKQPLSEANYISAEPHVSANRLQIGKDEFLVIACDGLWDVISHQDALDAVAKARQSGQTPMEAAQSLAKQALEKGSKDNVTVIVTYFHWRPN